MCVCKAYRISESAWRLKDEPARLGGDGGEPLTPLVVTRRPEKRLLLLKSLSQVVR